MREHDPAGHCAGRSCDYEVGGRWSCEYEPITTIPARTVRPELDAADCIAVGSTLRALARTNPQCGDALERVGAALVKAAMPKEPRVRGVKGCL